MSFGRCTKTISGIILGFLIAGFLFGSVALLRADSGCDGSRRVLDAVVDTVHDPSDDVHLVSLIGN